MSAQSRKLSIPKTTGATDTILLAGLAGGVLDAAAGVIVYFIFFGFNPLQVLQLIASGIYGPTAIGGSFLMVVAGLGLHFLIAFVAASVYFFAFPKISLLSKYPVAAGLAFGLAIWLFMNILILPNSNIPKNPFNPLLAGIEIIWHMALVGLPMAIIIRNYYEKP